MTRILAIDSSRSHCAVALRDALTLYTRSSPRGNGHAQNVLSLIQAVADESGHPLQSLDVISVIAGPGSFTGVRIAVGVAQGLALALGTPVVTLSTLEALAATALHHHAGDGVLTLIEASDGEAYYAAYRRGPGMTPEPVDAEQVLSRTARALRVQMTRPGTWLAVGDAWQDASLKAALTDTGVHVLAETPLDLEVVCALAHGKWSAGGAVAAWDVMPHYLKEHLDYRTV